MYEKKTINTSSEDLYYKQRPKLDDEDLDQVTLYKKEKRRAKNQGLKHLYQNDYKPAVYRQAVEFKNACSYKKKIGDGSYKTIDTFEDTEELKVFGLGPYFFVEFQRRMVWLFFIISLIEGLRIYMNVIGTGLQSLDESFGSYMIATTIGNYDGQVLTAGYDSYIMVITPCVTYFGLYLFYLMWKCHYQNTVREDEEDIQNVKPEKFCVEIEGFEQDDNVNEDDLEGLFSKFGPVFEVSLAREYAGKLKYFEELEDLHTQIKEEELEMILGYGDKVSLASLKKERDELQKYVNTLSIKPCVSSAFIHFQFQKSKVDMLSFYSDHYLFSNCPHWFMRSCCMLCIDEPKPQDLYKGNKLYIKNDKVPEPEDINWDYFEVGLCGKITRILISFVVIIVFLGVSCTIIGLCSIYISSKTVNCESFTIPDTLSAAKSIISDDLHKRCYCEANLASSLSDSNIREYCGVLMDEIYIGQGIQYAIAATSALVNFLFGLIVDKIVNLSAPLSHSQGYMWKNTIYTTFIILNTCFLPLLIYGEIFGFKAANYVSLITIVSSDIRAFFEVENISFYPDFSNSWYRNVSPVFTNYIVLDLFITWAFFLFYKCVSNKESLEEKEGQILQKEMNEKITSWKLNAYVEYSYFNLIIFLSFLYSGGIPVMIPLGFVNLLSKYVVNRNLIQTNSSKIPGLSESFNYTPFITLPLTLLLSPLVASWMLSANQELAQNTSMKMDMGIDFPILQRQFLFPFFLFISLSIVLEFLMQNLIIRFCSGIASCCFDRKKVVHPYHTKEFSYYAKFMSVLSSYNIRNNMKYKNVILNLEKYLDAAYK